MIETSGVQPFVVLFFLVLSVAVVATVVAVAGAVRDARRAPAPAGRPVELVRAA